MDLGVSENFAFSKLGELRSLRLLSVELLVLGNGSHLKVFRAVIVSTCLERPSASPDGVLPQAIDVRRCSEVLWFVQCLLLSNLDFPLENDGCLK